MYSEYVYLLFALQSDTGRSQELIAEHFIISLSLLVPTVYPYNVHARGTCVVLPVSASYFNITMPPLGIKDLTMP